MFLMSMMQNILLKVSKYSFMNLIVFKIFLFLFTIFKRLLQYQSHSMNGHWQDVQQFMENQTIDFSTLQSTEKIQNYPSIQISAESGQQHPHVVIDNIQRSSFILEESSSSDSFVAFNESFSDLNCYESDQIAMTTAQAQQKPKSFIKFVQPKAKVEQSSENNQQFCQDELQKLQSIYMTPSSPIKAKQMNHPQAMQVSHQFEIQFKVAYFYIKNSELTLLVNTQSLEQIYDELFRQQKFVPLFNYQLYNKWFQSKEQDKYQKYNLLYQQIDNYLKCYIGYINSQYSNEFQIIVKELANNHEHYRQYNKSQKQSETYTLFHIDISKIVDSAKKLLVPSKTQILKQVLISDILTQTQILHIIQKQNQKALIDQIQTTLPQLFSNLGKVEMLISFENTYDFCLKKIEATKDGKSQQVWIKYRDQINKQKQIFIQNQLSSITI